MVTTQNASEIAIAGYKPNDRGSLWFVPLTDIAAGTEIALDQLNGRNVPNNYRAGGAISAGTLVAVAGAAHALAPTSVIFIDSRVEDLQTLIDGAKPGTQVWVLNANADGLQQMADVLEAAGLHDLDAIHIVSHGSEGALQLGSTLLNAGEIAGHAQFLADIGAALNPDGDLLLYGCDVASGDAGLQFIADLADVTGADVAASTDATGHSDLGGNWTLEANTGAIEAATPFAPAALDSFVNLLANETFTATQTITLATDLDGDGAIDPGDTVTVSITILNNSTNTNATGVSYNQILAGMTEQPGIRVTPIAADDSGYTLVGNTPITFNALQGVLANDVDPNGGGGNAGLTAINLVTDANTHGTVVLNTDGSFTFTPDTGYSGLATFRYTARDAEGLNSNVTGVVTLTVTDPVWYVDSLADAGNDGSFGKAFATLAEAAAASNANDTIFVYNRGANYSQATGITLDAGEQLLGDGSSLTTVNNNLVGASTANSTFVVTGNSINAVTLGSGNTISGINIQETGTAGNGIVSAAGGVGTLHLISVGVTTTGNGIALTTGGTVDATGTNTISSSGGTALNVSNTTIGAADLTFQSISAGTGANSAGNGITLDTTGASGGLHVTGTGTAGSGGTVQHKTGADLGRASGIGIYLNNTAEVQLDRMQLNDFDNFAIRGFGVTGFTLANSVINGVNGNNVSNLGGTDEAGEGAIYFGNAGVTNVDGLGGNVSITNSTISGGRSRNVSVSDTGNTGGELHLTVSNTVFGLTQNIVGNQSFILEARNAGTVSHATITGSTFQGAAGDNINFTGQAGTTIHAIVGGATPALGNTLTNTHAQNNVGGGSLNFSTAGTMFFNASNNTMSGADGSAVTLFKASAAGTPTLEGTLSNNTIGTNGVANSGSKSGNGVFVSAAGTGTMTLAITDNTIQQYAGNGGIYADNTGGSYVVNLTVTGNTVRQPGAGAFAGIAVTNGSPTSADSINVFAKISGNDFSAGDPNNANDIIVGASGANSASHTFTLSGATAADVALLAAVQNFLQNSNNLNGASATTAAAAYFDAPVTLANAFDASAGLPPLPTAPVPLLAQAGGASAANPDVPPTVAPPPAVGEGSLPVTGTVQTQLTQAELDTIVAAAILRWNATGLTDEQQAYLHVVRFSIADMQGLYLGTATLGEIIIDSDGAGYGWFLDATPNDDAEFSNAPSATRLQSAPAQLPTGHIDLLTTVMHELSHQLGLEDTYDPADRDSITYGYLVTGERRLPAASQAVGAIAGSIDHEAFAVGPVAIGTLPFGKSVTVSFDAIVNAQNNQLIVNPSNQGTVSGTAPFPAATTSNIVSTTLDSLTLGGTIWNDNGAGGGTARNGLIDGTEAGVNGVLVSLFVDANNDNTPDGAVPLLTTLTAGGGNYSFAGLAPGNYLVRVDQDNFDAGGNVSLLSLQVSSPGNPDPDNNTDNDDNGSHTIGQPAFTQSITLAFNTEPTPGTGNDTNTTLDLGFFNNVAPVATASGGTTAFTEGNNVASTPVVVDSGFTVTDADDTTLVGATVAITGGFQSSEDVLAFTDQNGIVGNYTAGTGILTLTGAATVANYQTALRSVTYTDTSETPNIAARTVSFTVNDGVNSSTVTTKTVSVASVNDTPIATTSGGTTAFTEGNNVAPTPVAIDGGVTVTDADTALLLSATVSITGGLQTSEDVLAFTDQNGIVGNYAAGTGILTLNGIATVAQYQTALRSVTYTNTSDTPNTAVRTVSFTVNDGTNSAAVTKTVSVAAVDDAPIASNLNAAENYTEDTALNLNNIVITDLDSANVTATLTLSNAVAGALSTATAGAVTSTFAGGVWQAVGALADVNTLLAGVSFNPTADFNGNLSIATSVSDGTTAVTGSKAVTGIAVNDAPAGADKTVTTPQNTAYTFTAADFGFTDPNDTPANSLLAVTISSLPAQGTLANNNLAVGVGQSIAVADITGGLLKFAPLPNTTGNGYASFTFRVQDNGGAANGGIDLDSTANNITVDVTTGGSSNGDPHLMTFDGWYYDFQAQGDFVLVRGLDSDLEIQVRHEPWALYAAATVTTGIATLVDGHRFILDVDQANPLVDGVAFDLALGETRALGEGTLSRTRLDYAQGDQYTLAYGNGDQLVAQRVALDQHIGDYMNTNVYLIGTDEVIGLLGNNNGQTADDLALRDGTTVADPLAPEYLYGAFEDSWLVRPEESLFVDDANTQAALVGNPAHNAQADLFLI